MQARRSIWSSALLLLGILFLLNLLGREYFFRIDMTASDKYTLNEATLGMLDSLDRPVTVTAYLSNKIPTALHRVEQRFKELLQEYEARSDGNVAFQIKRPEASDKKKVRKLAKKGIKPRVTQVTKEGKQVNQRIFMGALIKQGDRSEPIPFLGPNSSLEYELTTGIRKVSMEDKPDLALIQGHGEASLPKPKRQKLRQMLRGKKTKKQGPELAKGVEKEFDVLHEVKAVELTDTTDLSRYRTVAIIAPSDTIPSAHRRVLDRYLRNGGRLIIAMNRVKGRLRRGFGRPVSTGLGSWLADKGINVKPSFLLDRNCMQMQALRGKVNIPYYPKVSDLAKGHPITSGLELVWFKFASPISLTPKDSAVQYEVLARSSGKASTQGAPTRFDVLKDRSATSYDKAGLPLAVAAKGPIEGSKDARMVVVGDGDFPLKDNAGKSKDNVNLIANAVDWLAGQEGIASLRSEGVEARPIKAELTEGDRTFLRYANFLGPILILLAIGFVRYYVQKRRRSKWKDASYVQAA